MWPTHAWWLHIFSCILLTTNSMVSRAILIVFKKLIPACFFQNCTRKWNQIITYTYKPFVKVNAFMHLISYWTERWMILLFTSEYKYSLVIYIGYNYESFSFPSRFLAFFNTWYTISHRKTLAFLSRTWKNILSISKFP
jgi:hypothetical protein